MKWLIVFFLSLFFTVTVYAETNPSTGEVGYEYICERENSDGLNEHQYTVICGCNDSTVVHISDNGWFIRLTVLYYDSCEPLGFMDIPHTSFAGADLTTFEIYSFRVAVAIRNEPDSILKLAQFDEWLRLVDMPPDKTWVCPNQEYPADGLFAQLFTKIIHKT